MIYQLVTFRPWSLNVRSESGFTTAKERVRELCEIEDGDGGQCI